MRILEVAPSYWPEANGIGEVVSRVAVGLSRRGHEVHVATRALPGLAGETIASAVRIHRFSITGNRLEGVRARDGEIGRYLQLLRAGPWDIVHFHTGHSWTLDLVTDQIANLPGRHVFTPHGTRLGEPRYAAYYESLASVYRTFDVVTCLSETYGEKPFASARGLRNTVVIPNGIEPSEYGRVSTDVRRMWGIGDRPFVLNVSNHVPAKGHGRLFELADHLTGSIQLYNVGGAHRAARWGLGRAGIRGGCYYSCHLKRFLGGKLQLRYLCSRPGVASALASADAFVLTSTWEASPLVILEAMASGLPWVSFNVGNVAEYPGGFIVADVREMAQCLVQIVGDAALRRRLGEAGRAHVTERHSWNTVVRAYEHLFEQLVTGASDVMTARPEEGE